MSEVDVERLLRSALVPIEPSGALTDRLEERLSELTSIAAEELADWELSSMRDPRNWGRPVAAVVIGGTAAGALVVVRARQQQRKRETSGLRALEKSVRGVAGGVQQRAWRQLGGDRRRRLHGRRGGARAETRDSDQHVEEV